MPARTKESKVANWLANSNGSDGQEDPYNSEVDELAPSHAAGSSADGLPDPQSDWEIYIGDVERRVKDPKTRVRLATWSQVEDLASSKDATIDSQRASDIVALSIQTLLRYTDKPSKLAALQVLKAVLSQDSPNCPSSAVSKAAALELKGLVISLCKAAPSGSPSTAFTSRASLLSAICCTFSAVAANAGSTSPAWTPLVHMLAQTFDSLSADKDESRSSKYQSILTLARRTIRDNHSKIPALIDTITETPVSPSSSRQAPLLGLICDVSLRLRAGSETTKGSIGGIGRTYLQEKRTKIVDFYLTHVLPSKTAVPSHAAKALADFFEAEVPNEEVASTLRPVMEKMLIRSFEVSGPIVNDFFSETSYDTSEHLQSFSASIISASKSSVPATRTKAVTLFSNLARRSKDPSTAFDELLALIKSGKTASADQRAALFEMLTSAKVSTEQSLKTSEALTASLSKETTENGLRAGLAATLHHLLAALRSTDDSAPAKATTVGQALAKELQNAKVPLRKVACMTIGDVLLSTQPHGGQWNSLADSLAPALEANLKNATTNTLTSASGPLEGYVAISLLLGPLAKLQEAGKIQALLSKNTVVREVLSVNPKPSFLLYDKVHRKFSSEEEEVWLTKALQSLILARADEIEKDEVIQQTLATALVQVGLTSRHAASRKAACSFMKACAETHPLLASRLLRLALLIANDVAATPQPAGEDENPHNIGSPAKALLLSSIQLDSNATAEVRSAVLQQSVIVAHLPLLQDTRRSLFPTLCTRAGSEPREFVEIDLSMLLDTCNGAFKTPSLRTASLAALASLAQIAPESVIAEIISQVEASVSVEKIQSITAQQLGILVTPPDTTFVDVLSDSKDSSAVDKNRKDAKIEQWEAELRADLAKKKAAQSKTLTKEQRAKVDAQLKVEAGIRSDVAATQSALVQSLQMIKTLVSVRSPEFDSYLPSTVRVVLKLLQIEPARQLAQEDLLQTFEALCSCASGRLAQHRLFIRVILLRTIDEELVSEDLRMESLGEQVIRVLYRLRFLSEEAPLDLASIAIVMPLVSLVIAKGGIDVQSEDETDGVLEQIQLVLEIIDFHAGAAEDVRFPRGDMIDDLVTVVAKYSKLARDAVGALRSLGAAIEQSALPSEISKLLKHSLAQETYVRLGALQALQSLDLTDLEFPSELWLACHDPNDSENARLAVKAWEENGLDVPAEFGAQLLPYLQDDRAYVRRSCGKAIAAAVEAYPESLTTILDSLYEVYRERNKVLTPEYDQFGMVIESTRNRKDPWQIRAGIAHTFADLAALMSPDALQPFFDFLISQEALGDRQSTVRQQMLEASSLVVDLRGNEKLSELISRFESFLAQPPSPSDSTDGVIEGIVVLLGRLARHLTATDRRISSIVERLLDALKTPSEMVQVAVADCLPALVPAIKSDVTRLVEKLFNDLLLGQKYAERRGAAYGLAGMIKGRGISAIAEFQVMKRLATAVEDKTNVNSRQSAVECYGILAQTLRRLFEPYIIEGGVLPQLITSFGDSKNEVRDATEETAKVIMQNVSAYCANLMMPTLLEGLEEKQWRTKKGAIELLGAYSSAAPAQLAAALPTVIPRLSGVLSDAHPQVRAAGNRSLKQFGSVMKNPEVKSMVPTLLQALVDPTSKTSVALQKLLSQTFAHYLDAPSLALVVPIVDRGLRDRSAQVQRDGAKITGNLASLTDGKDLRGHLTRLLPLLREVLVSPVPEARAEAARALGVLVERLGEVQFPDLVPSLMAQLRGETVSGVDRQGAAQGLSEVLAALGMDRLDALLPSVLENTSSPKAHVREGGIALLIYLPGTFGTVRFGPYVSRIVGPILNGLADTSDSVRDMSMRAGRMIIGSFSTAAVDLLLPELEQGMFDDTPRIRLSSLQLCGELLFRLGGISGKNTLEADGGAEGGDDAPDESIVVSNSVQARLKHTLGEERFTRTMATIFCLRQDPGFNVRDAAASTWKAIIVNTAKTIRELLPMIIDLIIRALSTDGEDQREIASRTLGEITRKLGGSVLEEIVPQLQQRGSDPGSSASVRAGVMLAVESVLQNATDAQLGDHEEALINAVRQGLVDRSSTVREAAASAFDTLQESVGQGAVEAIIPTLLGALQNSGEDGGDSSMAETALAALREVMRTRADSVFPASLPTLLVQPISAFNARALGDLVGVAGSAINKRLSNILGALAQALDIEEDEDTLEAIQESVDSVLSAVNNFDALHQLMMLLLGWAGNAEKDQRKIVHGCRFFTTFATNVAEKGGGRALEDYNADWVRRLAGLLDNRDKVIVDAALPALAACVETMEDPEELVIPLRHAVSSLSDDPPGLARKEGFGSCSAVFLAGLMSGTGEQKEQAAVGLGLLVEKAAEPAIKPFVTTGLAGPLIRACGERHAAAVKAAILATLEICLQKIPQHLKPFYPQLSRSFLKAAGDPTGLAVRTQAGLSLGTLATTAGARLDLNALINGARSGINGESAATDYPDGSAHALSQVLLRAEVGNTQIDAVKKDIYTLLDEAFTSGTEEERFRIALGPVLAGLAIHDATSAQVIVEKRVLAASTDAHLSSVCIAALLEHCPDVAYGFGDATAAKMAKTVGEYVFAGPAIARPAREAKEWMKTRNPWASDDQVIAGLA